MEEPEGMLHLIDRLRAQQSDGWRAGEPVVAETYFELYPELLVESEHALELIYHEVLLREAAGECPQLDEYLRRFPQFAVQLPPLFEVHRALASSHVSDVITLEHSLDKTLATNESPTRGVWPTIAGYELLAELGRGGMGVVYKARHLGLNRVVALKMILTGCQTGPAHLARFRAEAEAVARVQHANIVQVYDVGEQDGRPYFSLEFLNGGTLAQKVNGTPQPARAAAKLIHTLAQAIHAAHQQGIIHRDLKPANILVQESSVIDEATVKITDFGLAKQMDAVDTRTGSGTILGTASYMAPEQAEGKQQQIGPAADVYALGAILYELLSGRPPFKAETQLETMRLVLSEEPVSLSRLHLKVPRDLETICLKCLQKDSRKRYASAQALVEDLEQFLLDRPIQARRTGPLERGWRWGRRNPAFSMLILSICLLVTAITLISTFSALWLGKEAARARNAERDATDKLWNASLSKAQALRLSGRIGQRFESLEAIQDAVRILHTREFKERDTLALRNQAIACLALTDLRVLNQWQSETPWPFLVAFDGNLERYAYGDELGDVQVRRAADHQVIACFPNLVEHPVSMKPHFSPNGRYLAVGSWTMARRDLRVHQDVIHYVVWDLSSQKKDPRVLHVEGGYLFRFTPDSRAVAVQYQDGTLRLHDLVEGKERVLSRGYLTHQMAFRPDGRQLACAHRSFAEVRILDVESGAIVVSLPNPGETSALGWRGDGQLLAAASDDNKIYIWDVAQHRQQAMLEGHRKRATTLTFSPDGRLLASSGWSGTTRLWDVAGARCLMRAPGTHVGFTPDGGRLAFQSSTQVGIWELADARECRLLQVQDSKSEAWHSYTGQESFDYSADGRLLASVGGDGIRLWDVANAKQIEHLPVGYHEALMFHPDGRLLFTYGRAGLQSWPVERIANRPVIQIGPPQSLDVPLNTGWFNAACSRDGRVLAVTDDSNAQIIVLSLDVPSQRVLLPNCSDIISLAVSQKGDWIAAGLAEGGAGIDVWDAHTGQPVQHLPGSMDKANLSFVAFSPDDQWLIAGGQSDYRWWKVGAWESGPAISRDSLPLAHGPVAFSRDGRLMALARSGHAVQLYDLAKRCELATLTPVDEQLVSRLCFNPDGTELAVSTDNHVIQLWDLRALRDRLHALALEWDAPFSSSVPTAQENVPTLQVDVRLGKKKPVIK